MQHCPCVVCLCGAPAAGKSSLARALCDELSRPRLVSAVYHISFDEIERSSATAVSEPALRRRDGDAERCGAAQAAQFDPVVWAAARESGLAQLRQRLRSARPPARPAGHGTLWCQHEACLLETEPWPTVAALAAHELEAHSGQCCAGTEAAGAELVLVDDNMHLRSMRQACYRLAAEEGAAFVTVHVSAALSQLLRRNAARSGANAPCRHATVFADLATGAGQGGRGLRSRGVAAQDRLFHRNPRRDAAAAGVLGA